jgi:hypothetical protein
MARKSAGGPAIALIVSGVLGSLYALVYLVWTLLPLLWGLLVVVANVAEDGLTGDTMSQLLVFVSMPALQSLLFLVTVITGFITLFAGIRFNQWRSPGLVWLGIVCSVATPVLGAFGNGASLLNCGTVGAGIMGCLMGNAGTIPVFIVGLIASIWGAVVMSSEASENFE